MLVKELKNKQEYNQYVSTQKQTQFPQSWEWGEFLKSEGRRVLRLGFFENDKLFFTLSLFKNSLPVGFCYYSAPRIDMEQLNEEQSKFVFDEIAQMVKREKTVFLRFEPGSEVEKKKLRYRLVKTIDMQPSQTLILDLFKNEEELLREMHQKTRYNIRLAERREVTIRKAGDQEGDFEKFWNIMKDTSTRDGFRLHTQEHYKKMLSVNSDVFKIRLYFAEYKGEVLTANIISFFGNMVTYVHGASSNKHRNVMAPYLLQWHVALRAKKLGFKFYDFFGIDEQKWPGVTRFKRGFGGEIVRYPGTFDLVFSNCLYSAYKVLRKIRRLF